MADRQAHDDCQHYKASSRIAPGLIGPIGTPSRAPGEGRHGAIAALILQTVAPSQMRVKQYQGQQPEAAGPNMQGEKACKRERAELRSANRQAAQPRANQRKMRKVGDADVRRPEAVLVPGEQIAREVQSQRRQANEQDRPEEEFPRGAIRAADDHLHQVKSHQHQCRLAHVKVDRTKQPALLHVVLEVVHAFPGTLRPACNTSRGPCP